MTLPLIFVFFLIVAVLMTVMFKRFGNQVEKMFDALYALAGEVNEISAEISGIKTSLRVIADTTAETEEAVKQMRQERAEAETPDEELARRAKEEIDRFNAGIANILSFGTEERDGERK